MSDILTPLTIDFLTWLATEPRDYTDVMDAWRTSCPRLTVWEDAIDANLITRVHTQGQPVRIQLTHQGHALLEAHSPPGRLIPGL
jgi:2,4-dienoyl-CoA reductase-like NADH-dependent reductase (Old Yellow Enzyme family)